MMRLASLLWIVAACGGDPNVQPDAAPDGGTLQMNDVTILFPLGAPSEIASHLSASESGERGTLLPQPLYDAVGHIAGSSGNPGPGGTGDTAYADLRVVAVRIDPCFAALVPDPHGAGCENQLRVVFQELKTNAGQVDAFDSGLHVFYRLTRDEVTAFARAVASLRVANSQGERLGGLAPHSIMVRQGAGGAMATGVRSLVLKYAGTQNLMRMTKLSATNAQFAWSFGGFDVADAAAATISPMVIPTLAADTVDQTFFRGFTNAVMGQFSPATTSVDNLVPLADEMTAQQLAPAARQAAFDGLVHIDNPSKHSPNTIDCASCHLATPVAQLVAKPLFAMIEANAADAFVADGTYVLPSELTPTFDPVGPFNIHAFSYVGASAAINQRTVNETAAIVAYLNAN